MATYSKVADFKLLGPGMRGGRGGMNNMMMGGMPMGGMPVRALLNLSGSAVLTCNHQMGNMPGVMGMPMNMGQMGGGMQGMNNPDQFSEHNSQYAVRSGKLYPTTPIIAAPLVFSVALPDSEYKGRMKASGSPHFTGIPSLIKTCTPIITYFILK